LNRPLVDPPRRLISESRQVFSSDLPDNDQPERRSATWAREPAQPQHYPLISLVSWGVKLFNFCPKCIRLPNAVSGPLCRARLRLRRRWFTSGPPLGCQLRWCNYAALLLHLLHRAIAHVPFLQPFAEADCCHKAKKRISRVRIIWGGAVFDAEGPNFLVEIQSDILLTQVLFCCF